MEKEFKLKINKMMRISLPTPTSYINDVNKFLMKMQETMGNKARIFHKQITFKDVAERTRYGIKFTHL